MCGPSDTIEEKKTRPRRPVTRQARGPKKQIFKLCDTTYHTSPGTRTRDTAATKRLDTNAAK
jgi:hypothetical protein